jgi:hypothetical protein
LSFLKRLSTTTSPGRRPVPTSWVPQNRLSQLMLSLPGVRSPNSAIRLRLCAQRRWSAYESAIGFDSPAAAA